MHYFHAKKGNNKERTKQKQQIKDNTIFMQRKLQQRKETLFSCKESAQQRKENSVLMQRKGTTKKGQSNFHSKERNHK